MLASIIKKFPLLIQPRLLSIINTLNGKVAAQGISSSRATLLLTAILMLLVFIAASSTIQGLQIIPEFEYVHLQAFISFTLLAFFCLALLTSLTSAISVLFTSQELDRLFAAPLKPSKLYIGKLCDLSINSGAMLFVIGAPLLLAYLFSYAIPLSDWPAILFAITTLFVLAFSISYSVAIIAIRFIPLTILRACLIVAMLILIGSVFFIVDRVAIAENNETRVTTLNNLAQLQDQHWLKLSPAGWTTQVISSVTFPANESLLPALSLLGSTALVTFLVGYLLTILYYQSAYTGLLNVNINLPIDSKKGHERWNKIFFFLSNQARSLLSKELKLFARDFSQLPQLALLIGLCLIYIINFKHVNLSIIESVVMQKLIQPIFLLINIIMGGFITCAIATRFIYPSVSLDGRSFWITAVAPISIRRFLRYKFWIWYWPTSIITATVLTSGAFALQADPWLIALTSLTAFVISFGIVGLAIGIGTIFVNFSWEHQTQLTASMGSLVFIISAVTLVVGTVLLISVPVFIYQLHYLDMGISLPVASSMILICFALTAYINYLIVDFCMRQGVKSLRETNL